MIRRLTLIAIAAIQLVVYGKAEENPDEKAFALSQRTVFDLLWHIDQPDKVHPDIFKVGNSWDIQANVEHYTDKVRRSKVRWIKVLF